MRTFFNSRKFYDLENSLSSTIDNRIKELKRVDFESSTLEELTDTLFEQYKIEVPALLEDKIYIRTPEDVKIPVEKRGYGKSTTVDGTKFTFVIPFEGDPGIFSISPSTYLSVLPYGHIESNEIRVTYEVPIDKDSSRLKTDFDTNLNTISKYLTFLDDDVAQFNKKLTAAIRAILQRRKDKLEKDIEVVSSFGFPVRS